MLELLMWLHLWDKPRVAPAPYTCKVERCWVRERRGRRR